MASEHLEDISKSLQSLECNMNCCCDNCSLKDIVAEQTAYIADLSKTLNRIEDYLFRIAEAMEDSNTIKKRKVEKKKNK